MTRRAIELFTELIVRRYAGRFAIGEHPEVTYKDAITPALGRMEISTRLIYKGNPYAVIYRIEQGENWRITDVIVEGVSFIANYRPQFGSEYQKGGGGAVLKARSRALD